MHAYVCVCVRVCVVRACVCVVSACVHAYMCVWWGCECAGVCVCVGDAGWRVHLSGDHESFHNVIVFRNIRAP